MFSKKETLCQLTLGIEKEQDYAPKRVHEHESLGPLHYLTLHIIYACHVYCVHFRFIYSQISREIIDDGAWGAQ